MQGSTFEAVVDVANEGTNEATQDIEFYWDQDDDDGDADQTEEVTLEGGEKTQVTFEVDIDRDQDIGDTFDYYVTSEDDSDGGSVEVVDFESARYSASASSIRKRLR
ncbi:hypothetical protein [Natranaerofaba carboxydovora]|uniref:hypothetical protein n=1 Tax=Natranaerofaba carboxydovora TaxID=2742683 RepID=UPI001F144A78|nr:hypothetical protein [Natranaerofaba carboxydovora]UMZ74741.1 hypothetical protein ACONDI_02343 [Natranaerofaba carboxydovora]